MVDAPEVFGALLRAALDLLVDAGRGGPVAPAPAVPDHSPATVQIDR
jgi:hypothetical protein